LREAEGFSTRFPFAAFEDVELGLRLKRRGLVLHYEPQARAYHHHALTLRASLDRMRRLAAGALLASETEPDLVFFGPDPAWRRIRRAIALHPVSLRVVEAAAPFFVGIPGMRERYFTFVHNLVFKAELRRLKDRQ
jgi:GT2 family glycosyltransferase